MGVESEAWKVKTHCLWGSRGQGWVGEGTKEPSALRGEGLQEDSQRLGTQGLGEPEWGL